MNPLFGDDRLPAHIWAKIADTGTCWRWTAARDVYGYGNVGTNVQSFRAHRFVYQALVGPIPAGLELDHTCHKWDECAGGETCPHRACVNPAHLEPVTTRENQLRGNGMGGKNSRKTHCDHGHPFDEQNTRINRNGSRSCRACSARCSREYWARTHGAAA